MPPESRSRKGTNEDKKQEFTDRGAAQVATTARPVDDIVEFVGLVDIQDIIVHEERGRRISWTDDEKSERQFPVTDNSLGMMNDEQIFKFRFRAVFSDEESELVSDVEIVYVTQEPVATKVSLRHEFAERVAFMAIYPFIRASIFGSASRLGVAAPVLSIIRQGEFAMGEEMTDEQIRDAFGDTRSELT